MDWLKDINKDKLSNIISLVKKNQKEKNNKTKNKEKAKIDPEMQNLLNLFAKKNPNKKNKPNEWWDMLNSKNKSEFEKREQEYLYQNTTLDEQDYQKYFTDRSFKQWQIWDCYFVSALRSFMENDSYKTFIKTSVRIQKDENGKIKSVLVKLPLWEPYAKPVKITKENFETQINRNSKKNKNEKMYPLSWSIWAKIIEAAYFEYTTWKNNPNFLDVEGWFSHKALATLLWKENIKEFSIGTDEDKKSLNSLKNKNDVLNKLLFFNKKSDIIWLSSIYVSWKNDKNVYDLVSNTKKIELHNNHAYSIVNVNKSWLIISSIDIVNPHDTSKIINITLNELMNSFRWIRWATINKKSAFDNVTKADTLRPVDDRRYKV